MNIQVAAQICAVVAIAAALLPDGASAATTYVLSRDSGDPQTLTVSVDRSASAAPATALVLRGVHFGMTIRSQVEGVSCDGHLLQETPGAGSWPVPAGCRHLSWHIPLDVVVEGDASLQRSVGSTAGSFLFVSETSSLPRLVEFVPPELLSVPPEVGGETIPRPQRDGTILMPKPTEAPLFLLVGSRPVAERSLGRVHLAYFLDDPAQVGRVPAIDTVMRGLAWLTSLAPASDHTNFAEVWLGLPPNAKSIGGAAGSDLLVANYIRGTSDGPLALRSAAVPLSEAVHQLGRSYGKRPGWVEESLANFFGIEALRQALSDGGNALDKSRVDPGRFPFGLIEAQRRVTAGDQSAYGMFFTEGVAFWTAVDAAMRAVGVVGGLGVRLPRVWTANYDHDGRPPADFATILGLSADTWRELNTRFLGS